MKLTSISCGALAVLILSTSPALAAVVYAGYEGTLSEIDTTLAAALPPGSPIALGAHVVVNFSYESTTPDTDPSSSSGVYSGAILDFSLYVGGQRFDYEQAGPENEVDILADALLNVFQPVASVVASPQLPIAANLEGDVIFLSVDTNPLSDDSLLTTPPDPNDPNWETAEAAIYDDASKLLINAELSTQCAGTCEVPAAPVSLATPMWLMAAIALSGVRALRR